MPRRAITLQVKPPSASAPTQSLQGYPAWVRPLEERFLQVLMTNTLGNTFYETKQGAIDQAEQVVGEMIKQDPYYAAKAIVYARNKGYMRTLPIYALARLSVSKPALAATIFDKVISTPNDLSDFTHMVGTMRTSNPKTRAANVREGTPTLLPQPGRAMKEAGGKWLVKNLSEYWAVKYGADKSGGYSLKDLIRIYHPKYGKSSHIIQYILGKGVPTEGQIWHYERFKAASTPIEKAANVDAGRLPHEVTTAMAGDSPLIWSAIGKHMPILALLMNLATLERHKVIETLKDVIKARFTNPDIIAKSRILPFKFLKADEKVTTGWVKDALRDALDMAFVNLPEISGRTAIFLDVSGSMTGTNILTAAIFGISLAKKATDAEFYTFDTSLTKVGVSMRDSTLTQARNINPGGGTDTSLGLKHLLKEQKKVDNIILITDEQQNVGVPMYDLFYQYQQRINPEARLFIIDVSSYGNALTPQDSHIYYIYGWSDHVLDFIGLSTQGWDNMAQYIRAHNDT